MTQATPSMITRTEYIIARHSRGGAPPPERERGPVAQRVHEAIIATLAEHVGGSVAVELDSYNAVTDAQAMAYMAGFGSCSGGVRNVLEVRLPMPPDFIEHVRVDLGDGELVPARVEFEEVEEGPWPVRYRLADGRVVEHAAVRRVESAR